jgi:hypothetical protein
MFEIQDKYKDIKDLVRRVIEPAKKELTEKAPCTFNYVLNRDKEHTGRGRKPIKSITITPIHQPKKESEESVSAELAKRVNLTGFLTKGDIDYIIENFGFTKKGIKNNHDLFIRIKKKKGVDFINWLATIKENASKKRGELRMAGKDISNFNMAGWLINSLRLEANIPEEKKELKQTKQTENKRKEETINSPQKTTDASGTVTVEGRSLRNIMQNLADKYSVFKNK